MESVCLCFIRLVQSFPLNPANLRKVAGNEDGELLKNIQRLVCFLLYVHVSVRVHDLRYPVSECVIIIMPIYSYVNFTSTSMYVLV